MKRTLRCISIVLALMMVFSGVAQADEAMPCASSYITLYGASLEKTTTTWFKVWFEVVGTDIMDELGTCSIEVQRSSNGIDGWTTMRTYLSEDYAQMI